MKWSGLLQRLHRSPELLIAHWQAPAAAQKLIASYLDLGNPNFPLDIPLRGGGIVRVFQPGEVKVFWQIFIHRCYRLWPDCRNIVDAGANIGVFSVWTARRLPQCRILALEPFPETFARLQHNIRANDFGSRIETLQLALSAHSGERAMPTGPQSQRRSLVAEDEPNVDGQVVSVPSMTLAELMERHRLTQIDLLKMDIEGSEWEVLMSTPSSVLRGIRRIQFEYHEVHARFGYTKADLFAHLRDAGFQLTHSQEDQSGTGIAIVEQSAGAR
jgi:FkbM family methyltransferase